jgi:spermidine synthase
MKSDAAASPEARTPDAGDRDSSAAGPRSTTRPAPQAGASADGDSRAFAAAGALFLVSGATGLLYEVAFSKFLATIFGATAYAVSTVLASFMAGLALGAHVGGRYARRVRRPLVAYGVLELTVGAVCALTPSIFAALSAAYVAMARSAPESLPLLTFMRAALTVGVVVLPTVAMGATLPVLSRQIAGRGASEGGRRLAWLYGINTFGGATGALLSAYAILPAVGVRGSMLAAALVNGAIGLGALAIGWRAPRVDGGEGGATSSATTAPTASAADAAPPHAWKVLCALAMTSGFLVFAAEVVQTHLLALLIGNSAYAFGLMLAIFLSCLALGAARAPAFARKHGDGALPLGLSLAALSIAITIPLWDLLPLLFVSAGKVVHSWAGRELTRAAAAFGILALPTLWMGTTFPLLLGRMGSRTDVAARVGRLTVLNTSGTIVGSVVTGYLLLPALGSQATLICVAAAFALAAALCARSADVRPGARRFALGAGGLAVALAVLLPSWDLGRLTSGANVYFALGPRPDRIDFVREDVHGGVTTVAHRAGVTTMYTNGKFQGDDGPEMIAQRRFAHFPSLFVAHEGRALVIGLGTGTTLGTIAAYPYRTIDVAEISPAIVEAARTFFQQPMLGALDDPRVHMTLNDGRNVLLVAREPYDLVTIELTSVWFAGASSLYSAEFYDLVKSRLTDTGVLQQWVQLHHIRPRELGVIVRTLHRSFPHVALFVGGAQGILVAGKQPLVASSARLLRLDADARVATTLGGARMEGLLDEMVFSGPELERFAADTAADGGPLVSTDDNLYLEYATPKGNVLSYDASLQATLALLERYRLADPRARHLGP